MMIVMTIITVSEGFSCRMIIERTFYDVMEFKMNVRAILKYWLSSYLELHWEFAEKDILNFIVRWNLTG